MEKDFFWVQDNKVFTKELCDKNLLDSHKLWFCAEEEDIHYHMQEKDDVLVIGYVERSSNDLFLECFEWKNGGKGSLRLSPSWSSPIKHLYLDGEFVITAHEDGTIKVSASGNLCSKVQQQ